MNDIEKAINDIKFIKSHLHFNHDLDSFINRKTYDLAISALEKQKKIQNRIKGLETYNQYEMMSKREVILILKDFIVEVENE